MSQLILPDARARQLIAAHGPEQIARAARSTACRRELLEFVRRFWRVNDRNKPFTEGWALEAIADHLTAVTNGWIKRLIINVPPGPISEDALVLAAGKGRIRLADVVVGDRILAHSGKYRRVEAVHEQGVLPLLRVTTIAGRVLDAAPNHPFLTTRGWVEARHLTIDDTLAAVAPAEEGFADLITPEEARIMGYLVGDGSVSHHVTFHNTDPEILDDFARCCAAAGFGTRPRKMPPSLTKLGAKFKAIGMIGATTWLRQHGLWAKNSYTKRIPDAVLRSSATVIANFLGAYWSCDGNITVRHSHERGSIYQATASTVGEGLAADLHHALLRVGIAARVRLRINNGLKSRKQPNGYRHYLIHTVSHDETAKVAALPGLCSRKRPPVVLRQYFEQGPLREDKVKAIETIGEGRCRCLTVAVDHTFAANDLVVKNSTKSLMSSVFWPAWEWGPRGMPWMRYICASYSGHLTLRDNRRFKRVILDAEYQEAWGRDVHLDLKGAKQVSNAEQGWKLATSLKGVGTGERGNRIVIDDANNPRDVESEPVREGVQFWIQEVMPDRLNDLKDDAIVCIQQRTHEKDATGTLLDLAGLDYVHLCYDAETEVLTPEGWVRFPDLGRYSQVMAVDPATLQARWELPTQYIEQHFHGQLIHYKSTLLDLAVTPDHRMVFKDFNDWNKKADRPFMGRARNWRVAAAKDLPNHFYVPQAVQWTGAGAIAPVWFGGEFWHPATFADFMGWYLAEGCADAKRCNARIVQNDGAKAEEIAAVLAAAPFASRVTRGRHTPKMSVWHIYGKQMAAALAELGDSHTKRVPDELLKLAPEYLQRFIIAFAKGDGSPAGRNGRGIRMSSRSKRLIDGLQQCAALAGWASTVTSSETKPRRFNDHDMPLGPMWHLYIRSARNGSKERKWYARVEADNVRRFDYHGLVYCVSVPSTALLVRRNGRVTVSGNCIPAEYEPERHCITVLRRDADGNPAAIWEDPRGLTVDEETGDVVRLPGLMVSEVWRPSGPAPAVVGVDPESPAEEARGELFWPERIAREQIEEQKTAKGPAGFAGQYQQLPGPRGGGIIRREWWRLWASDTFPDFIMLVASLDTAFKESEEADYNALTVWGVFLGESGLPLTMLKYAWRTRCGLSELVAKVGETCLKHKVDRLLIEDKARGHDVAAEVRKQYGTRRWTTQLIDPVGDKVSRAHAVQPLFSGDAMTDERGQTVWGGGLIWAPDQQWAEDVISECERFPRGEHDDYVDTVTQYLTWARKAGEVKRAVEHALEERERRRFKPSPKPLYDV